MKDSLFLRLSEFQLSFIQLQIFTIRSFNIIYDLRQPEWNIYSSNTQANELALGLRTDPTIVFGTIMSFEIHIRTARPTRYTQFLGCITTLR